MDYNCIAWAADDQTRWWWPQPPHAAYWPPGVPRALHITSFVSLFRTLGYEICAGEELEAGYEKVAIFADATGEPKHAARQLPKGGWTSKLGAHEDIRHTLRGLTGAAYGEVVQFMRRPRKQCQR